MFDERGPLMFINTASTSIQDGNEQKIYDSRYETMDKIADSSNICIDEKKLRNIIEMYNKKHPVYCEINYKDEILYGIPYKRTHNKLSVYVTDENSLELDLNDISCISIIRF